ncbi:MAG: hypothetical protein P1P87_00045 [Trueperaceae bacterium]|nr:hypothetical protein [Trueperaceae bacterium]
MVDWLGAHDGVRNVHDLRVWALSTTRTALAAHLALVGAPSERTRTTMAAWAKHSKDRV